MTIAEILTAAKALIDTPEKWAANGNQFTGLHGPHCASTAIGHASQLDYSKHRSACRLLEAAYSGKNSDEPALGVIAWNDRSTHAEVMAGFDRAVALAKARGL